MRTEKAYVRPFQIVVELAQVATAKLAVQPRAYQREHVEVLVDGIPSTNPIRVRRTFVPVPEVPPQVITDEVWRLQTDGFYLNDFGKAVVRWPNDLCGTLSVRTFDVVHDFYTPQNLDDLADELMGIVATGR